MIANNLPGLNHKQQEDGKDTKKPSLATQRMSYKGITLKEYFRLCDEGNGAIQEMEEESRPSSKSSLANTPNFP